MPIMHEGGKICFPDIGNESAGSTKGRDGDRIIINVGGLKHETHLSTLRNFPDTRLSWMVESPLTKGCNSSDDGNPVEYFFDRHPGVFVHILNYYRTGKLHCPADVCGPLFEEELNFWGIDELQMEPCCWSTYTRHRDAQAFEKVFSVNTNHQDDDVSDDGEPSGTSNTQERKFWCSIYKQKVWELLEKPYSSKAAQMLALFSLMIIVMSVVTFCLETIPDLKNYKNLFELLDYAYCAVFTFDFLARVTVCPDLAAFFRSTLTWCDIMSVIPFYIDMIWAVNYLDVVLVVRLFRIFRLFRFFRFMSGMQVIGHTLKASARELLLLVLILLIPMVIFSSLLFYTEQAFHGEPRFYSIPHSFWWAVITMTTVGYGDICPQTALGRFIGTLCACSGVLIVALPVSVIGSNFNLFYSHAQAQLKLPKKRRQPILVGAASALMSAADQITSPSGTDSDSESDTGSGGKLNDENKNLWTKNDEKDCQIEVESIKLQSKRLTEKEKSWETRKNQRRGCAMPEIGLEKGLKAMGDIMLNIGAPAQRRMAISGTSPSLRRSSSGKRRSRSKSGDFLRRRTNTSISQNCKIEGSHTSCFDEGVFETPDRSTGDTTDNTIDTVDDVFSMTKFSLPKSDSLPVVKSRDTHKQDESPECDHDDCMGVSANGNDDENRSKSEYWNESADSPSPELHLPKNNGMKSPSDGGLDLHRGSSTGALQMTSGTGSECSDAPVVTERNKLYPWCNTHQETKTPGTLFSRFGRRRSATLSICNV